MSRPELRYGEKTNVLGGLRRTHLRHFYRTNSKRLSVYNLDPTQEQSKKILYDFTAE